MNNPFKIIPCIKKTWIRQAKIRWGKDEALPEIERLVETCWGASIFKF
jgi:hypothetical protein